jgi:Ca2+-binding RTX toxin-like protein
MSTITGTNGAETLNGSTGNDLIRGLAGADRILTNDGADTIYGGSGNDEVNGYLTSGGGYSRWTYDGSKLIDGEDGDDFLFGGSDNDTLVGGAGNDTIYGYTGADSVSGGAGEDSLIGGDGNDSLYGGAGDDTLFGGIGNDFIDAGDGDDSLNFVGDAGNDTVWAGAGDDFINFYTDTGVKTILGDAGNDAIYGSDGGNSIEGGDGNDTLFGGDGRDSLSGGLGDDSLYGADGNDTLIGGFGSDTLWGGAGNDTYIITDRSDYIYDSGGLDTAIVSASFVKIPSNIENVSYTNGAQPIPYWISALLPDDANGSIFSNYLGSAKTFYYTFPSAIPSYSPSRDGTGFQAFNASQIESTRSTLAYIQTLIDVRFVESTTAARTNTLTFASNDQSSSAGYAVYPDDSLRGSDVFIDNSARYSTFTPGTYGALLLIHEIGHAIGLKHPFDEKDADGDIGEPPYLQGVEDSTEWTVMTYNDSTDHYQMAFRPLDIAALQYLYGPATNQRTSNDTYRPSMTEGTFVWDGAGTDTIDLVAATAGVTAYLTPGYWSYIGQKAERITAPGQFTVNFGSQIENLSGSRYADTLSGNGLNNIFITNGGNDTVIGGLGIDTIQFSANRASYAIIANATGGLKISTLSGSEEVLLFGVEKLVFTDTTSDLSRLTASSLNDLLMASEASETIDGGAGVDTVTYKASLSQVTIVRNAANDLSITDAAFIAPDSLSFQGVGEDRLLNVERVRFSDTALAFDVEGIAGKGFRIYKAAFNRNPDESGLGYWIGQMDGGMDLLEVSSRFIDSAEFRTLYGNNPSNADFLTKVYSNVLGRAPDASGYAWWLNAMNTDATKTKAKVLADFSESPENKAGTEQLVLMGIEYTPWSG